MDFAEIGGVYDDPKKAEHNRRVLQDWFHGGNEAGFYLTFGEMPHYVYFEGRIDLPPRRLVIDGRFSELIFSDLSPTEPALALPRPGSIDGILQRERLLHSFILHSHGSGIDIESPGSGTILRDIAIYPSGASEIDADGWDDLEDCSYGIMIRDGNGSADALELHKISVFDSGGHGFVIRDKLHEGIMTGLRTHRCAGTGFKGQSLRGCVLKGTFESNGAWGAHLRGCGISASSAGSGSGGECDYQNSIELWCESNGAGGSPYLGASHGHSLRQIRVEASGTTTISGHSGAASNKIDIDQGSRDLCDIVTTGLNPDSRPLLDIRTEPHRIVLPQNSSLPGSNNFRDKWKSNPSKMPIVREELDGSLAIRYPEGCFDSTSGTNVAYWRPWGLEEMDWRPGDIWHYEIELSIEAPGAEWCRNREQDPVQASSVIITELAPYSKGKCWIGIYDDSRIRCNGSVRLDPDATQQPTFNFILWASGFEDRSGRLDQPAFTIDIHELKLYRWSS